jgi:hypothetical protein
MALELHGIDEAVPEGSSFRWRGTLLDFDGEPIVPASVSSILLTLAVKDTDAVINGRDEQEVYQQNGGTLDSEGVFSFVGGSADSATVGSKKWQQRRLTLEVTFSSGTLNHEVRFFVQNLQAVP